MVNEQIRDDVLTEDGNDGGLEKLLDDAYPASPMPRSVLARIDRAIEAEWGESPRLAHSAWERLTKPFARTATWLRAAPAAAIAAILFVAVLAVNIGSSRSGWAAMLEALQQQDAARMETPDGVRWLSLGERVVVEQTSGGTLLFDSRQKVFLSRESGADEIVRRPYVGDSSLTEPETLVLAFLLGNSSFERFSSQHWGLRRFDEQVDRIDTPEGEALSLRMQLADNKDEIFEVKLTLNSETHLPFTCELPELPAESTTTQVAVVTYPPTVIADLRAREFPAGLAVVERSAAAETSDGDQKVVASGGSPGGNKAVIGEGLATVGKREAGVDWDTPDAVPGRWNPVAPIHASREEIVRGIDRILSQKWKELGIEPSTPADETELLRRVYLDLAGRTPTVHEVRTYLADSSDDRYERLVERLLKSPDHTSHLATVWRSFLIPDGVDLSAFGGVEVFDRWLADQFAVEESYDEIVRRLLLAEGRLSRSGPLLFYSAVKLDPQRLAARTSRVFLGMRLECAECHNHPFEPWSQEEFWGFAAFFARISRPRGKLENVSSLMRVHDIDRGEVMLPDTDDVIVPRFLDAETGLENPTAKSRRERLAQWLTDPQNPYFARATANRVWGHLFGTGIVDPVDDFGVQHRPKLPEVIDQLAGHFISSGFDLRELFRVIVLSKAYRLSSGAETADERRLEWFAQMPVKMLTAAQLYDCITVASLLDNPGVAGSGVFNVARFGNTERSEFLQQFASPTGKSTEYQGGIPQALTLMNGTLIAGATGLSSSGLLKSLEAPFFSNRERIEVLYLATLSRLPREPEWELLRGYIPDDASGESLRDGLADLLWVLLNSAEFTMNH